jgi:hypothetical protein
MLSPSVFQTMRPTRIPSTHRDLCSSASNKAISAVLPSNSSFRLGPEVSVVAGVPPHGTARRAPLQQIPLGLNDHSRISRRKVASNARKLAADYANIQLLIAMVVRIYQMPKCPCLTRRS